MIDLTPFQKQMVTRVFRGRPHLHRLFNDYVDNLLVSGSGQMSVEKIEAAGSADRGGVGNFNRPVPIEGATGSLKEWVTPFRSIPETPKGLNGPAGGSLQEECLATQGPQRDTLYNDSLSGSAVVPAPGGIVDTRSLSSLVVGASEQIPVTAEMIVAGVQANSSCSVKSSTDYTGIGAAVRTIYRAMAALAPQGADVSSPFEPTDADVENLAIALIAADNDCTFREARGYFSTYWETSRNTWLRIARAAFDHPGYLPSIAAARQDVARQQKALATARGHDLESEVLEWCGGYNERNAECLRLTAENAALRAQLAAFTSANVPPAEPKPNPFRDFPVDRRRVGG